MWEYVSHKKIYLMLHNKHCSIWYDVYIQRWRWAIVFLDAIVGVRMYFGISNTLSSAMLFAQRRCQDDE
jgi:hypothetical protein